MAVLSLEDFETVARPSSGSVIEHLTRAAAEVEKMASYEQGYQAGWDDAARAQAENQTRIEADFARNLQELSFTFHEARAHVIQAMEPLLSSLINVLLPRLVVESLGERILEELQPFLEQAADTPIELVTAPANRAIMESLMKSVETLPIRLTEEPSLAEGQVYVRMGKTERQIDLTGALDRLSQAMGALYDTNERILKHG